MVLRDPVRISAAEVGRNFGEWQSRAMVAPVVITHHGRDRLILCSVADFEAAQPGADAGVDPADGARERLQQRTLLQHIQQCFLAFDGELRITDANHRAELYLGLTLDDMRGRDLRQLKPFTADAVAWEYYAKILRLTHEPTVFQVLSELHAGSTLSITAFPYHGDVGALFSSTSPHEEAVSCLRVETALAAAVAADPDLSEIRLNLRGGITAAGEGFAALAGFPRTQLATMMLAEVLHPHDRSAVSRTLDSVLRDAASGTVQARLLARDGGVRRLRLNFSAVPGDLHAASAVAIAVDLGPDAA